jgi:hypothetical protein
MAKLLSGTRIYGTGTIDTQLIVSGSTAASSTNTGALQVAGGAGLGGDLYAGGNATVAGGTLYVGPVGALSLLSDGTIARPNGQIQLIGGGSQTTRNNILIGNGGGITIYGGSGSGGGQIKLDGGVYNVLVSQNTATVSSTTGALVVTGGVGIGGGVFVGGIITTTNLTITGRDIALGNSASATGDSVAIGFASSAIAGTGVSVGRQASSAGGIGIGYAAQSVGFGVSLGAFAGLNGATNGIVINATGSQLNGPAGGLVIAPIRGDATTSATTYSLYYNPVTKEITTATVGLATTATFARNIIGGTVGSLLVQTSTNSTGFVTPVNTSGYTLQSVASSVPRWVDLTPQVLNDISNQFDGRKVVFDLRVDQTSINTTVDSKDVEVVINGLRLTPYVDTFTYPWITPYDSFRGFRVAAGKLILYNAPYRGDSSYVMLRPGSTARQKRRYPFAATTVALGD